MTTHVVKNPFKLYNNDKAGRSKFQFPPYSRQLRAKRTSMHINQHHAAQIIGISVQALRLVEQGGRPGPRIKPKIDKFMLTRYERRRSEEGHFIIVAKSTQ